MEGSDTLIVIAELALGIAGFSGVVVVFHQGKSILDRVEANRLGVLLSVALGAIILALLPFVFHYFGATDEQVWRISNATMALVSSLVVANLIRAVRIFKASAPEVVDTVALTTIMTLTLVNLLCQLLSAIGVIGPPIATYLAGLIWYLVHAAYQFTRILFIRPAGASN